MGFLMDFEYESSYSPTIYEKFSTFSPVYAPTLGYQMDYAYAPTVQIDSPGAQGAVVTTKKEMKQTPDITGATTEQSPAVTQEGAQSDPMGMILILGLVAVGGFVLVKVLDKSKGAGKKIVKAKTGI